MAEILVLDDVLDAAVLIEKILTKKGHSRSGCPFSVAAILNRLPCPTLVMHQGG